MAKMWRHILILTVVAVGVFVIPVLFPTDPMSTNTDRQMEPPGGAHIFGTDILGRDVFSRTLYGGQRILLAAAFAAMIASTAGFVAGLAMGWSSGLVRQVADAVINAVLAFPGLLLALVVLTLLGRGFLPLVIATGSAQIAPFALVTRSSILVVRSTTYVQAAEALGAGRWHMTRYHIFPNIRPTLLAYFGVTFAYGIMNSAALSFLGLSGELGVPDWGVMLSEGRAVIRDAPWIGLAPGTAIALTVLAINGLVDHITSHSNHNP